MFARLLFMWKNADTRATKVLHTCDRPLFSRYWRSTEQVQSFIFSFSLACLLALASGALVEEGLVALCAHCVLVVCGAPFSFFPSPLFSVLVRAPFARLSLLRPCAALLHTHTHTQEGGVLFPPLSSFSSSAAAVAVAAWVERESQRQSGPFSLS